MRAGPYATFNGVTYRSDHVDGTPIWLLAPGTDPQPPGFEKDTTQRWCRRVERSELRRIFLVRTTARWKGRPVSVRQVLGDRAFIEYVGGDVDGQAELFQQEHGLWDGEVHVDSLSEVVEVVEEIPSDSRPSALDRTAPASAERRAGAYAVVDGATYPCADAHASPIRVLVPLSEPQPAGFERDNHGRWSREVELQNVSRLFRVSTTATWRDRTVKVHLVFGDRAYIEYEGLNFNGGPELTLTDYTVWRGSVPVGSLTDWVEGVKELPRDIRRRSPLTGGRAAPAGVTMRAGTYAVVGGVTYRCAHPDASPVRLLVPGSEPQPAGFRRDEPGRWVREVDPATVSLVVHVATTATWRGRAVVVREVFGDRALIEDRSDDDTGGAELTLTDDSVRLGWVSLDTLTNVVERAREAGT